MSLFAELKKRRVFRVAGSYVIVAWLLVQVADIFFPALKLPEWSVTLVAGMVILGFPVAVLLAWAYQITPEGVVRSSMAADDDGASFAGGNRVSYLILGLLVLVVGLLVFDRFAPNTPRAGESKSAVQTVTGISVLAGTIPLPDEALLAPGVAAIGFDGPLVAVSPNGRWLVYVGRAESGSQLYLHDLHAFGQPNAIAGTEGAIHAFFSPDGESIGFITDDKLKRVTLDGSEVRSVANSTAPVRGSWPDPNVIYIVDQQGNAVSRVAVDTGATESLIYSSAHRYSEVLDSGEYALAVRFPPSINGDQGELLLVSLDGQVTKSLNLFGFDARLLPSGHLMFTRNSNLQVVSFDSELLETIGKPRPVLGGVAVDSIFYQAQLAVSKSGVVAFVPGSDSGVGLLARMDRSGNTEVVIPQASKFGVFDLSHDDSKLAIHMGDVTDYVQVFDLERRAGRKLPGTDGYGWPLLSRTGDIVSSSLDQAEQTTLAFGHMASSGNQRLIELPGVRGYPIDWSLDGETLSLTGWLRGGRLGSLALSDEPRVDWFEGQDGDWGAVYSPDGKWISYSSNQTGRYEIWLRPADGSGQPRQLSVNGGIESVWCPCGKVFYRRGDEIWATEVTVDDEPVVGLEMLQFTMKDFLDTPGRSYDVSSDGETLYFVQLAEPTINDRIHVITNWLGSIETVPAE